MKECSVARRYRGSGFWEVESIYGSRAQYRAYLPRVHYTRPSAHVRTSVPTTSKPRRKPYKFTMLAGVPVTYISSKLQ